MTYYNEHSKVWLSVDCIIFGFDEGKLITNIPKSGCLLTASSSALTKES